MNFKYILTAVAVVAIAAACDKTEIGDLDNLTVDKSYVAIPTEGGSTTITVNAKAAWTFDFKVDETISVLDDVKGVVKETIQVSQLKDSWVTVSPVSGNDGETVVSFSADATTAARSATLRIMVGEGDDAQYQYINISQPAGETGDVELSTVAEVIAGPDGKTHRVQGTCTSIVNTQYGNWYLMDDEGNTLYIYGTVDKSGAYNWSSFDIAVGDVVTVQGPWDAKYQDLADVEVISVKKALLLSDESSKTIGMEAEPFTLSVTQKGEGIHVESSAEWLTVDNGYDVKGGKYVFTVRPSENTTGAKRTANVVFTSTKGEDSSVIPVAITQLATVPNETDGLAGLAAEILDDPNVTFDYILTDAKVTYKTGSNIFIEDATGGLLIYSGDVKLSVGDVVNGRVFGNGTSYKNLPEATSFDYSLATVTSGDAPEPTPVTFEELYENYDKYISRYVAIKNTKIGTAVDVTYSKVTSDGSITDGENSIVFYAQSSGKFDGNKIYFYLQLASGTTVDVVALPSIYNTTKQINIWDPKQITVVE